MDACKRGHPRTPENTYANSRQWVCRTCTLERARGYYQQRREHFQTLSREWQRANRDRYIAGNRERRDLVLRHYSNGPPRCACCGETEWGFLTIDHIENNGAEHRRSLQTPRNTGKNFYRWLIKNNYPLGFQVLCMNCNCAKSWWGVCPHQKPIF